MTPKPKYLNAASSLSADDSILLADGTMWSHAATTGTYVKGGEFTIGADEIRNAIKVFTTGYPRKIPVDYEHSSTSGDPEVRKLRAQGQLAKAGDVAELRAVLSADDFTGDLKVAAEKLAAKAGRELADPRNLGLWMRWKPTARALAGVRAGEFTELSIAFEEDMPNNTDGAGQGFGLLAVALCMRPFLDDMLPVAASSDDGPPPARPASREGSMKTLAHVTALAAVFAATVTSEEEALTELPKLLPKIRANHEFASVVSAELGNEVDPLKAVKVIRELRAENEKFKTAATVASKAAVTATVTATITQFEARINSKPLREMFARNLTAELEAGKKLDETETMVALNSLPKTTALGQTAGIDAGDAHDDDGKIETTARELMASNPRLKALAQRDEYQAYKEALVMAEKQLASA